MLSRKLIIMQLFKMNSATPTQVSLSQKDFFHHVMFLTYKLHPEVDSTKVQMSRNIIKQKMVDHT